MRALLALAALVLLSGSACDRGARRASEPLETVRGRLTDEGFDCPTIRDRFGQRYYLIGDPGGFRRGDRICVRGRRVEKSDCGVGPTILVEWLGPARACSD
jgi:hypothetical protein